MILVLPRKPPAKSVGNYAKRGRERQVTGYLLGLAARSYFPHHSSFPTSGKYVADISNIRGGENLQTPSSGVDTHSTCFQKRQVPHCSGSGAGSSTARFLVSSCASSSAH